MQLTEKESTLLKDLADQEKLCIDKYKKHAVTACDTQLKNLFTTLASVEQTHLDTLTTLQSGTVPPTGTGSKALPTFTATYGMTDSTNKQSDCYLCTDVLAGEKHVSALYDTCIFEFKDTGAREVLNHLQKEEQDHGKMIYDYMAVNGMYQG